MATGRIGVTPTLGTRWSKAPSAGTTSLSGLDDSSVSLVYSVGYEQVYRNGVLLSRGNDYTATSGNSITLTDATIAGDIIEVFANELIPLSDAISKGQFTAKGSLLSASAASTPAVLAVGSNDQVLTADSSTSTGLKWATPSSGGMTVLASGNLPTGVATTTFSAISGSYNDLRLVVRDWYSSSNAYLQMRFNGDTGSNYGYLQTNNSAADTASFQVDNVRSEILLSSATALGGTDKNNFFTITINDYANTSAHKTLFSQCVIRNGSDNLYAIEQTFGVWIDASAITSITLFAGSNFSAGSYVLYGVK